MVRVLSRVPDIHVLEKSIIYYKDVVRSEPELFVRPATCTLYTYPTTTTYAVGGSATPCPSAPPPQECLQWPPLAACLWDPPGWH